MSRNLTRTQIISRGTMIGSDYLKNCITENGKIFVTNQHVSTNALHEVEVFTNMGRVIFIIQD